ncbi:PREDICTED: uncharacterized protein LOC107089406 [Cyprinodon variegatus]|uniref:uncharacterized protein LOC107089406 n=1 Tax=Cyprinodon variegatus TaxID=28743 RepID=UPI0007429C79|nr:PREDICTED: uncharacterized protein LOC107089406 [Cyprinodon variegatus]XP_015237653.1 PREDICTED: uncharacterized protein LOC107089406 [Cyprinodon variegatus]
MSKKGKLMQNIHFRYDSGNWITNLYDLKSWRAVAEVEPRSRSDTNKPNSSPQTTILPVLRFPSNCLRNINLVTFDPDGDKVKCRYADHREEECDSPCTPPPVLSLSSNCTFSFNATSNKTEGLYAVQMVMEDLPRKQITLTQANGPQVVKTTSDAISRIPIQFGIQVDPVAPSCSEGDYLPRFLPPTPEHGSRFSCNVNQTLEIKISGIANQAGTLELLLSGPHNVVKTSSGSGNFYLKWKPSIYDEGPGHPICFVIQRSDLVF